MLFSQRIGKKPVVKIIQREEMDEELRNSLWNALTVIYWKFYQRPRSSAWNLVAGSNLEDIINSLWLDYFKKPLDKIPREWEDCLSEIRNYFFKCDWNENYDFIEFLGKMGELKQKTSFKNYAIDI